MHTWLYLQYRNCNINISIVYIFCFLFSAHFSEELINANRVKNTVFFFWVWNPCHVHLLTTTGKLFLLGIILYRVNPRPRSWTCAKSRFPSKLHINVQQCSWGLEARFFSFPFSLSFSTPNPDYLSLTRWPEERAEAEKQDGIDERILLTTLMTPYKLHISHEKRIPEYERRRIYDSNQLVLFANAFLPFLHFSENRIQSLRLWEEITCKTCMWSW